uniref:Uncharacterized protein n=1 Tax=Oryza punctata TaxID=4537 RepID=A0A0E0LBY4_ORYPU
MPSSSLPGGALAPPLPLPSSVAVVGEASMDARSSELEANNKKTTTIHKDFLLAHTEGQPCENISSGSDCDDIIILKRKLKSLKRKYVDLRESIENAKKSSVVVIESTNHGAVDSLFKSILENHTHSPDLDME